MLRRFGWLYCLIFILGSFYSYAETKIIIDQENSFSGWQKIKENKTIVFFKDGKLFLGGDSKTGDKCGITRNDLGKISNWQLMLGMFWSHNNAVGGHPTCIDFTDSKGNGYRLSLISGRLEILKLSGGQVIVLGKTIQLWQAGSDFTTPRNLFFSRDAEDKITAGVEGVAITLEVSDREYNQFDTMTVTYGVYCHGYAAKIDKVILKTTINDVSNSHPSMIPTISWRYPAVRIGILDFNQFIHPFRQRNWIPDAVATLARSGCKVEKIPAGELSQRKDNIDLLIVNSGMIAASDLTPLADFLRAGNGIWLIGDQPFGKSIWVRKADKWISVEKSELSESEVKMLHRLSEKLLGTMPVARGTFPAGDSRGLTLTSEGRAIWSFLPDTVSVDDWSFLPWNDSIAKQVLPVWVNKEVLISCKYVKKNWVQQKDTFTGIVAELMRHDAGEFAGARVVYTGLPLFGNSLLNAERSEFGAWSIALLNRMAVRGAMAKAGLVRNSDVMPTITRQNFLTYPGGILAPLCFNNANYANDEIFAEDLDMSGFSACQFSVFWLSDLDAQGGVIDWKKMDDVMKTGRKIIFDPYHFRWSSLKWSNQRSIHDPVFKERFIRAMEAVAERYRNNPDLVAMMVTPHTHTYNFKVDNSPDGKVAWRRYLQETKKLSLENLSARYKQPILSWEQLPLPVENINERYNVGPIWADYWNFHIESYQSFIRDVITRIRTVCPEMPLLLRGPYLEVGINMKIASEFKNVACHCECVETTIDTEGYFRALSLRFGLPGGAENGWPKANAAALKMAMADYLMGDYRLFLYSFAGPRWGRENAQDFHDAVKLKRQMANAHYPSATLGMLIADTTLFASRPPNFFSMEKLPHLEGVMERIGFPFEGVSAEFPRLDGLNVIIDDGSNYVITPKLRSTLTDWVRNGGTFIMYPHTGSGMSDGSDLLLPGALGIKNSIGSYNVGKGRVIVLANIPVNDPNLLTELFSSLKLTRDFAVSPFVSQTTLKQKGKTFLILYNKSRKLMESFFTESRADANQSSLSPTEVTITPLFKYTRVIDIRTGQKIIPVQNKIKIMLPPTEYAVLEFESDSKERESK